MTCMNVHLYTCKDPSYFETVKRRINEEECKIRKGSVLAVKGIVGATPEFIIKMSRDEQIEYFSYAMQYIEKIYRKENIIAAVIHFDENAPHLHFVAVPITADHRLSVSSIHGNPTQFNELIANFYLHMEDKYDILTMPAMREYPTTKRLTNAMYKKAAETIDDLNQIKKDMRQMNIFNMEKKKEQVYILSDHIIPRIAMIQSRIESNTNYLISLKEENQSLENGMEFQKENLKEAKKENERLNEKLNEMQIEIIHLQNLLRLIPSSVRNEKLKGINQFKGIIEFENIQR